MDNNNDEKAIRERIQKYVDASPYKFNPNEKTVAKIMKGLSARKRKYGEEYCPCRIVSGDKEKDDKIICPCVYHIEEIANDKRCHCDLIVDVSL